MCAYMCVYMCVCVSVYIYIYVCVCIYIYIYINFFKKTRHLEIEFSFHDEIISLIEARQIKFL